MAIRLEIMCVSAAGPEAWSCSHTPLQKRKASWRCWEAAVRSGQRLWEDHLQALTGLWLKIRTNHLTERSHEVTLLFQHSTHTHTHTHTHTSYNLHVQNRPLPTALRIIDQLAHPNDFTLDFMKIISNSQRLIMTNITINFHQLNIIVQFPLHCSVVIQNTPFVISEMIMINHSQPFPFHQRRT